MKHSSERWDAWCCHLTDTTGLVVDQCTAFIQWINSWRSSREYVNKHIHAHTLYPPPEHCTQILVISTSLILLCIATIFHYNTTQPNSELLASLLLLPIFPLSLSHSHTHTQEIKSALFISFERSICCYTALSTAFMVCSPYRNKYSTDVQCWSTLRPPLPATTADKRIHLQEFLWLPSVVAGEVDIPAGRSISPPSQDDQMGWIRRQMTHWYYTENSSDHNTCPPCILIPPLTPHTCSFI